MPRLALRHARIVHAAHKIPAVSAVLHRVINTLVGQEPHHEQILDPNIPHGPGFFFCGLVVGLFLIHLVVKKWLSIELRPEDKSVTKPVPLSPEQQFAPDQANACTTNDRKELVPIHEVIIALLRKRHLQLAEELAPIHEAIFAGRRVDAVKLYRQAKRRLGLNEAMEAIVRMEAELKRAHPEKFSAKALNRPAIDLGKRAELGKLLNWGVFFVIGLFILVAHWLGSCVWSLFWPLFWLLEGLLFGCLIRSMSSNKMAGWKSAYQGMRPGIKLGAWFLGACFAFAIAAALFSIIAHPFVAAAALFSIITHPQAHDPAAGNFVLAIFGLVAGWLLVHTRLKQHP